MQQLFPRLRQGVPIAEKDGNPTSDIILKWQMAMELLESVPAIQAQAAAAAGSAAAANAAAAAANAAAVAAQSAADTANAAADSVTSESSLVNSFVTNFAGTSPVSADNAGNVTVANHDRQYGDTALNPTVAVTGGVVATGAVALDVVRIYYDDPTRAGGAVTYLFTIDPADAPVQGGDRHVVGAVEVPAAGTSDGGYVRPPGYTGVIP